MNWLRGPDGRWLQLLDPVGRLVPWIAALGAVGRKRKFGRRLRGEGHTLVVDVAPGASAEVSLLPSLCLPRLRSSPASALWMGGALLGFLDRTPLGNSVPIPVFGRATQVSSPCAVDQRKCFLASASRLPGASGRGVRNQRRVGADHRGRGVRRGPRAVSDRRS